MTTETENEAVVKALDGLKKRLDAKLAEQDAILIDLAQRAPGGYRSMPHMGGGAPSISSRVFASDGVKALLSKQSRSATVTLEGSTFLTKNTITGDGGSPTSPSDTLVEPMRAGFIPGAFRRLRMRELIPVVPCSSNMVNATRELSWSNDAAETSAEGASKAESDLSFELKQTPVSTIAHFIKASKQVLDDAPLLGRYIDMRLSHGVLQREDSQIINGTGSSGALSGFLDSGNYTAYGYYVSGMSYCDQIRTAIEQLAVADYTATGIVLNSRDWSTIEREKDNEDRYLFANPQTSAAPMLWGLPVVASNSIAQGKFIVADFPTAAVLYDRQSVTVELGYVNEDFTKNLVTIRGEERVALAVNVPAAVIYGTFQ